MKLNREGVKAEFLRNVAEHSMTIEKDDGEFRNILFNRNGSSVFHFTLTTWPGYLAITGDMGAFVFSRVRDMFRFFRQDELVINPGYWAEKCRAENKHDGISSFCPDTFRECVMGDYDQFMDGLGEDEKVRYKHLLEEIETDVLSRADDGKYHAMDAALNFAFGQFSLFDFYEHDVRAYNYHFLWCLYAIVWGIQQYDMEKPNANTT